jgi:hypothetical protein
MNNEGTNTQPASQEAAKQPGDDTPPPIHQHGEESRHDAQPETEPPPVHTMLDAEAIVTFEQQGPVDQGGDAAVAAERDDWHDAETDGRCPENHYGWKPYCEDAISATAIAHLAVCHASDGTVWTRISTNDGARAPQAARELWDQSFPLFCCSADAQSIIRKMATEACWATGGDTGRRLCEAETRLTFAALYHARLAEHSTSNHLPLDILDQIQKWLRPEHQLLCAQGSSFIFQGESWVMLRFEPCTHGAAMLIARRGQKGLTAFRTAQSLVVALVDERVQDSAHGTATNDAGCIVDTMIMHGL